ncbi:hypothetical protein ACSVH2_00140 [Flavobacterium sp. RSB2_4_14]|uniref:hypothetical protein n=1 Tax=Flavobacterium sp. RSB2_4_14 TaxID=3447665 RepID=UPI003F38B78E
MKTNPITIGLMILTVSLLVSCKNNEPAQTETPVVPETTTTAPVDTTAVTTKPEVAKDSPMSKETKETEENEENEKNEK